MINSFVKLEERLPPTRAHKVGSLCTAALWGWLLPHLNTPLCIFSHLVPRHCTMWIWKSILLPSSSKGSITTSSSPHALQREEVNIDYRLAWVQASWDCNVSGNHIDSLRDDHLLWRKDGWYYQLHNSLKRYTIKAYSVLWYFTVRYRPSQGGDRNIASCNKCTQMWVPNRHWRFR